MSYIFFNNEGKRYAMNEEELLLMQPVRQISSDLKSEMQKNEATLIVALFLKDSSERTHAEVGESLGIKADQVKMMRHQFGKEGRAPYEKRLKILKKYYKLKILK